MDSKDSKIYPGIARNQPGAVVPYTRQVAVYVPAQYKPGTPAPFIVAQDGMSPTYRGNLPPILDNLIHEKRIPAIVAVMVHNGGGDAQGSQRGLDTTPSRASTPSSSRPRCCPGSRRTTRSRSRPTRRGARRWAGARERRARSRWPGSTRALPAGALLLRDLREPAVAAQPGVAAQRLLRDVHETSSPAHRLAARRVGIPRHLIPNSPPKPIRVWMHVSERDNRFTDREETWHNWVLANERMAAALKAKGYKYQYVYSQDSRHVDRAVVAQTLARSARMAVAGISVGGVQRVQGVHEVPRFRVHGVQGVQRAALRP